MNSTIETTLGGFVWDSRLRSAARCLTNVVSAKSGLSTMPLAGVTHADRPLESRADLTYAPLIYDTL